MQSSPCNQCHLKDADKKITPACVNCRQRDEYVSSLGKMTHSVPVELSDMGISQMEKRKRYTQGEERFLKGNIGEMTNKQLAEKLDRSEQAIGIKLSNMGLKRSDSQRSTSSIFHRDLPRENSEQNSLTQPNRFLLDFSDHPQLYKRLLEEAAEHFRTPQQQALYFIDNGINGSKINIIGPRIELVGKNASPDQRRCSNSD